MLPPVPASSWLHSLWLLSSISHLSSAFVWESRAQSGDRPGICEMRQVLGCGQSGQSSQSVGWAMVAILEWAGGQWPGQMSHRSLVTWGWSHITRVTGLSTWRGRLEAAGVTAVHWPAALCSGMDHAAAEADARPVQTAAHNCSTAAGSRPVSAVLAACSHLGQSPAAPPGVTLWHSQAKYPTKITELGMD